MLLESFLIIARTVLRPAIRMMNAALGWLTKRYSHIQRPDCQIPFHPVADHCPAVHCEAMSQEGPSR